ncbi:integration host factor subunit alpha [Novosphingobium soli]|uniref:Integration host factor subunit alpha n=1 Tax=Novosphingobium soli TaxID=574956 RepID=A0ABV6CY65_9SPHN
MRVSGNLTRLCIAEAIHRKVGLSKADSFAMVEKIMAHMSDALASGENVKISGFGTFLLRDKGLRLGRNPKTGEEHAIAPRRVLTFRASPKLKERIVRPVQDDSPAKMAAPRELVQV